MQPAPPPPDATTLHVAVFAGMAELVGGRRLALDWSGGSVDDLRQLVARRHPEVAALLARSAVAVDGRYAADGDPVGSGADVAIIPPVSGG
ncbi:MAG: MoaD/ThiS family protein [Planctomycetota bacterium]|nr:MoaD/ThiS family protein [Planctomycetota bacterium]